MEKRGIYELCNLTLLIAYLVVSARCHMLYDGEQYGSCVIWNLHHVAK